MRNIENNLNSFYRYLGNSRFIDFKENDKYLSISHKIGNWPQLIFGLNPNMDPSILLKKIHGDILNNSIPLNFIANKELINESHIHVLKEFGFVPLIKWKGMYMHLREKLPVNLPVDVTIKNISKKEDFEYFTQITNESFRLTDPFSSNTFQNILKSNKLQIKGLFLCNTLVTILMAFISENHAGFYFIATKKEFRGKGYASLLIKNTINELYHAGIKEVVLHANIDSIGLYEKIGFSQYNNFVIYRKIQNNG